MYVLVISAFPTQTSQTLESCRWCSTHRTSSRALISFFGCTQLFREFHILRLLYSPLVNTFMASSTYAAWPYSSNNINTGTGIRLLMLHLGRLLVIMYNPCRWPAILSMMLNFIGSKPGDYAYLWRAYLTFRTNVLDIVYNRGYSLQPSCTLVDLTHRISINEWRSGNSELKFYWPRLLWTWCAPKFWKRLQLLDCGRSSNCMPSVFNLRLVGQ